MCVLWEGSTGATSRQLQQALILPSEPDTVRVGMRDLHRHLKSYFGHNGYLQGVELSRDKETSLRVDFIPVLRIYGYHMEEKKPEEGEENPQTGVVYATTTMAPDSAMQGSNSEGASTQSPEVDLEEVTVLPEEHHNTEVTTMSASTESSVDPMQSTHSPESMNSTTQSTSESSKPESTTTESMSSSKPSESMSSTTESMSNKPESMSSTSESTLASESSKPESMISTTESMSDKPESMSSTTDSMLASKPESMSSTSESTLASESSKPESMTSTTESMSDKPESMALVSSTSIPEPTSTEVSDLTTLTTMHSEVTTMHSDMSTGAASEALTVTSMPDDETQTQGSTTLQSDEATPLEPAEENEDEEDDKNVLFPDIALTSGRENMTEQTEDVDNDPLATRRSFRLFSGTFTRPVPVMERRGELLPFASLPGLRSIAAMLPLDDPRYGLLVLLPTDGRGPALKQLAAELTQVPLRKVLAALRISRLHVTLPKFAARGPIVLTSSLQQVSLT
ncbi:hypothetical protein B566_EDAN007094 [Ephemera danica]|nr:hypothetical protein B566_EDAN007094 [Ephemera danica]